VLLNLCDFGFTFLTGPFILRSMAPPTSFDHNKLITAAAKQALSPLGLKRSGKSRLWYDDHAWWCIIVEFQPSSWSKGTYLNVGVSWLLFEKAYWTFDVGHREHGFSQARGEQQFSDVLSAIVNHATDRVRAYRDKFATIQNANSYFQSIELRSRWDQYHAAPTATLAGDIPSARKHFDSLLAQPRPFGWQNGLYFRANDLSRIIENKPWFLDSVTGIVHRTRVQLGLDDRQTSELGLPIV
jgi:hypothetical protein